MNEKKNIKKYLASLLVLVLFMSFLPMGAMAGEKLNDPETVVFTINQKSYLMGNKTIETDVAPYIKEIGGGLGRTMVPVAFVAPALGTESAKWFPNDQMVMITKGKNTIAIFIDSKELLVNGKKVQMDVAAEIVDIGGGGGRTMLPIAFIARALDVGYQWIGDSRSVYFYGKNVVYDQAGTFGPDSGEEVIEGNVIVKADGVKLQNLSIKGNLTIAEEVGDGDVYLTNIHVNGETYIRGGGSDSIHINGGQYKNITIQNVGGQVRVVATDVTGAQIVIAEEAQGQKIILEGNFEKVTIEAKGVIITTQGQTTIQQFEIKEQAKETKINLGKETVVKSMIVDSNADVQGEGTIDKAQIKADGVNLGLEPKEMTVASGVTTPTTNNSTPSTPAPSTPSTGGSGGGGGGSTTVAVSAISVTTDANLAVGATQQLTATVSPSNATNKAVTWSSSAAGVATVNASGLVTAVAPGTATITVTTVDGGFQATATITVIVVPTGSAVILSKVSEIGMPTSEVKVEIKSSPVNHYTLYFDDAPLASTTNGVVTIATAVLNDLSRVKILYNSEYYTTVSGGSW